MRNLASTHAQSSRITRAADDPESDRAACHGAAEPVGDGDREASGDGREARGDEGALLIAVANQPCVRDPRLALKAAVSLQREQDGDLGSPSFACHLRTPRTGSQGVP